MASDSEAHTSHTPVALHLSYLTILSLHSLIHSALRAFGRAPGTHSHSPSSDQVSGHQDDSWKEARLAPKTRPARQIRTDAPVGFSPSHGYLSILLVQSEPNTESSDDRGALARRATPLRPLPPSSFLPSLLPLFLPGTAFRIPTPP